MMVRRFPVTTKTHRLGAEPSTAELRTFLERLISEAREKNDDKMVNDYLDKWADIENFRAFLLIVSRT